MLRLISCIRYIIIEKKFRINNQNYFHLMSLARTKDTTMKGQCKGKYETKQIGKKENELRVAPPLAHSLLFPTNETQPFLFFCQPKQPSLEAFGTHNLEAKQTGLLLFFLALFLSQPKHQPFPLTISPPTSKCPNKES